MKALVALVLLVSIFLNFTDCKKPQAISGKTDTSGVLTGRWELRHLDGCQIPGCKSDYEKGNGNILVLTDTSIASYQNGQLIVSDSISFGRGPCEQTSRFMNYFIIGPVASQPYYLDKYFFEFKNGTLIIYLGLIAADGSISTYARI